MITLRRAVWALVLGALAGCGDSGTEPAPSYPVGTFELIRYEKRGPDLLVSVQGPQQLPAVVGVSSDLTDTTYVAAGSLTLKAGNRWVLRIAHLEVDGGDRSEWSRVRQGTLEVLSPGRLRYHLPDSYCWTPCFDQGGWDEGTIIYGSSASSLGVSEVFHFRID